MPYVNRATRPRLDAAKATLIREILDLPEDERDGAVNYCISEIFSYSLRPRTGWRYRSLQYAYGVFFAAAAEFYRRLVAPYEDTAIAKNGDVPVYSPLMYGVDQPLTPELVDSAMCGWGPDTGLPPVMGPQYRADRDEIGVYEDGEWRGVRAAMTEKEREAQRQSFAYGNVHLHNATITREDVAQAARDIEE